MAIGTEGQYVVTFDIGNNSDFIAERELLSFTLIEDAGNTLPTFQLDFLTSDEKILNLLHEGNDIQVSYGNSLNGNNVYTTELAVTTVQSNRAGSNLRRITCAGLYSALGYLGNSNLFISDKTSGIAVVNTIIEKHFTVNSDNLTTSLDSQNWVQYNITDRAFVNKCWLYSDLGNSFPAVGITSHGEFLVRDVLKEIGKDYTWRFSRVIADPTTDIVYDEDPVFTMNTAIVNNWTGYSRQKLVYDSELGTTEFVKEIAEPSLSLGSQLIKRAGIDKRFAAIGIKNDNVHENYWNSYQKNIASLAQFGSLKLSLSFSNVFQPVKVLDIVSYREDKTSDNTGQAAGYHSGLYMVSKVSRTISNRAFSTLVQLVREAPNDIQTVSNT